MRCCWLCLAAGLLFLNVRLYAPSPLPQIYGDLAHANAMAQVGETIGLPWTQNGRKFYIGRALPIGDIIVSYSYIARSWFSDQEHFPPVPAKLSRRWRWGVHA